MDASLSVLVLVDLMLAASVGDPTHSPPSVPTKLLVDGCHRSTTAAPTPRSDWSQNQCILHFFSKVFTLFLSITVFSSVCKIRCFIVESLDYLDMTFCNLRICMKESYIVSAFDVHPICNDASTVKQPWLLEAFDHHFLLSQHLFIN